MYCPLHLRILVYTHLYLYILFLLWSLFRLSNIQNTAHICGHFANNLVHSLSNPVLYTHLYLYILFLLWSLFRLSNIQNTAHICGHFANNLVHSLSNPVLYTHLYLYILFLLWSLFRLSNIQNTAHICGHFANNLVHSLSNPVLTFNLPPLAACKGKTLNWLKPLSEFKNLTPLMASWECLCCSKRNMTLTVRWRHHVECTPGAAGSVTDFPITFWRLSSITKQTHDNMESFCFIWF